MFAPDSEPLLEYYKGVYCAAAAVADDNYDYVVPI
jgi:hypothetical protein